jgi:hypothetical protein
LYFHGHYIDWTLDRLVREGTNLDCHLLLAAGATPEECDLSSNFLATAYGEYSLGSGQGLGFGTRVLTEQWSSTWSNRTCTLPSSQTADQTVR